LDQNNKDNFFGEISKRSMFKKAAIDVIHQIRLVEPCLATNYRDHTINHLCKFVANIT
jgi:hypothetical protein